MLNLFRPRHSRSARVWSAGGLVCRADERGGVEVLLVGRTHGSLWTIPKGTPEAGEPVEYVAAREVSEETGLVVHPVCHVRDTSYSFLMEDDNSDDGPYDSGRPDGAGGYDEADVSLTKVFKTVHWYLMHPVGGDLSQHDDEFDVVRWMSAPVAARMLTYPNERKVIDDAVSKFRQLARRVPELRLTGELATVRSKLPTDAWDDYQWRSDPELADLDATAPLALPFDRFQKVFMRDLDRPKPESMHFAIDDADGRHIGNCMFYDIDRRKRSAEFGIMIGAREYWGRGYGADASKLLIDHAFRQLPIDRLYLHTLKRNARAQTSFGKAGFRRVDGVSREGTEFVQMEITRVEWQASGAGD